MATATATAQTSKGLTALLRRGWHEIPEVIMSGIVSVVGIGLAIGGTLRYIKNDGDNKVFKTEFTVYRPDDPRVKLIRDS